MLAGVKFDETRALRLARGQALLFPNAPLALARLGSELLDQGDAVPAAEALSGAVRGEPSSAEYRVLLSRAWLLAGEIERACQAAKAAVSYDGDDPEVLEADARCELARGNPQRALERLEHARVAAPNDQRLQAAEARLRASLPISGQKP
jgi:Flp pilus assembly protein TadD